MNRVWKITLLVLLLSISVGIKETNADTHVANVPSYDAVSAAIAEADPGDTVLVGPGTATWNTTLVINKGIILKGSGSENTIIYGDIPGYWDYMIHYEPASPSLDESFRLTGFTMDGNGISKCVQIRNKTNMKLTKIRIDNNRFQNTVGAVAINGTVYGVIDSNNFFGINGSRMISVGGNNESTWLNHTFDFGTPDNIYAEDNIFEVFDTPQKSGSGGRYCSRFNTFSTLVSLWPWYDWHGNMSNGGNLSAMGVEIYRNVMDAGTRDVQFDARGGKAVVFDNHITGDGHIRIQEEFNDSRCPPAVSPISGQPQHVSDSYFWSNTDTFPITELKAIYEVNVGNDEQDILDENVHFFNQNDSFDGTTGVGVGVLADLPHTCTTGVGYWATDQGRWNESGSGGQGSLYKCTAPNTWIRYYTPYYYPHPLRLFGPLSDNPSSIFIDGFECSDTTAWSEKREFQ